MIVVIVTLTIPRRKMFLRTVCKNFLHDAKSFGATNNLKHMVIRVQVWPNYFVKATGFSARFLRFLT